MTSLPKETSLTKDLGIMVYIDNNETMLEEFGWIYKSWIYSGNWKNSDLLVVHHPDVSSRLPLHEAGVIGIPFRPPNSKETAFENYAFANSIICLSGPHIDPIAERYPYLLRTDADVFLTSNLVALRPTLPVYGRGLYHHTPDFRENMLRFCAEHGIQHRNHFGCGHSLLDASFRVIHFLRRQAHWMNVILDHFGPDPQRWGAWPDWNRGVSSMYAAEVAAHEYFTDFLETARERILDVESFCTGPIDALVFHIHAIHTNSYFSKFKYRAGEYSNIDIISLDKTKINQYCHWIVAAEIEKVKEMAGYNP